VRLASPLLLRTATVEFLYHPGDRLFAFLRSTPCSGSTHHRSPIPPRVTGPAQLARPSGGRLPGASGRGAVRIRAAAQRRGPRPRLAPRGGSRGLHRPPVPGNVVEHGQRGRTRFPAASTRYRRISLLRPSNPAPRPRRLAPAWRIHCDHRCGANHKASCSTVLEPALCHRRSSYTAGSTASEVGEGGRVCGYFCFWVVCSLVLSSLAVPPPLSGLRPPSRRNEESRARRSRLLLSTRRRGAPLIAARDARPLELKLRGRRYRVRRSRGSGRAPLLVRGIYKTQTRRLHQAHNTADVSSTVLRPLYRPGHRPTAPGSPCSPGTHWPFHLVEVDGVAPDRSPE